MVLCKTLWQLFGQLSLMDRSRNGALAIASFFEHILVSSQVHETRRVTRRALWQLLEQLRLVDTSSFHSFHVRLHPMAAFAGQLLQQLSLVDWSCIGALDIASFFEHILVSTQIHEIHEVLEVPHRAV